MTARFIVADVFEGLAQLEDGSVDLVVTSPPFLALRSYLPADHPDKGKEIGSEATPAEFIDTLLAVTAELRRVLAPHGSICIELGDTYAGSGGAGGDYGDQGLRDGQPKFDGSGRRVRAADVAAGILAPTKRPGPGDRDNIAGWPLAKSKTLIPELYEVALAYGFNPLTGRPSGYFTGGCHTCRASAYRAELHMEEFWGHPERSVTCPNCGPVTLSWTQMRWRVRNIVDWCKPNPPVGALGDKWRPATSDVVVACVSDKRYWDDIATRRPSDYHRESLYTNKTTPPGQRPNGSQHTVNSAGAPLLDYWEIPPGGYPGSHYAVFPPALVEPLIKAMAPPKVCRQCGEPSRRIVGEASYERNGKPVERNEWTSGISEGKGAHSNKPDGQTTRVAPTLGWTDCGHDDYRPALILDPFAGSGTTLSVATGHGHDAIGIDLDERNRDLAYQRIGPFMWEEETA